MSEFCISRIKDLYELKHKTDLDQVTLITARVKKANLLRYGLKYALWALRVGGRLIIQDNGPQAPSFAPFTIPFRHVVQQAVKVLAEDAKLLCVDDASFRVEFERTKPVTAPGWSAGILFSGNRSEIPTLDRCIKGLLQQPELGPEQGGEILIVGPDAGRTLVPDYGAQVRYAAYEMDSAGRIYTARKKNFLAARARNPRLLIMHARILLQPGCLAALPREFDVITPRVEYHEGNKAVPYLDWGVPPTTELDITPRHLQSPYNYDRQRYLDQLKCGRRPYIDGGVFACRTEVLKRIPLSPHLAWGEAEDLEWCSRLHAEGVLVDLEPGALALSQSFKWKRSMLKYGKFWSKTTWGRDKIKLIIFYLKSRGS